MVGRHGSSVQIRGEPSLLAMGGRKTHRNDISFFKITGLGAICLLEHRGNRATYVQIRNEALTL